MKYTPHDYQFIAIKWLVQHPEAALFLDPGMGKTSIGLAALKQLFRTKAVHRALVVGPLRVARLVWSNGDTGELGKWDDFKGLRVTLLHGPNKDDLLGADSDIFTVNYEGLLWLCEPIDPTRKRGKRNPTRLDILVDNGVDCIIFDELSKMKNHDSKRYKMLKPHLRLFRRRWGFTGTPSAQSLEDLFGEAFVLDMGKCLGQFVTHFRHKYFCPCGFEGREWELREGADKEIYQALKPLAISMRAEDHLEGMPKLVEQDVWVDLTGKARSFYDEFEREMIADLDGETIIAKSAATVSNKCRQVASGGIYHTKDNGNSKTALHVHDEKTDALAELIDELQGAPLLVGYDYAHDRQRIEAMAAKHFKTLRFRFIDGSTSEKGDDETYREWNAGRVHVLGIHPKSAGHGLNLQGSNCAHVAWYTLPWSLDEYIQLNDRVYRQGNKSKVVFVHRIMARDTVDIAVSQSLHANNRTQEALLNALRAYVKGRR